MSVCNCPAPGSGGRHSDPRDEWHCEFCGLPIACDDYRPDHNGECLNCDEPAEAHAAERARRDA
jgi:hypothetical protein